MARVESSVTTPSLFSLPLLAFLALPACIIVADDVDANGSGRDSDVVGASTSGVGTGYVEDDGSTGGSSGAIASAGSETTAADPATCDDNVLSDPGFEAGTPNQAWTESSVSYGTPLCDGACSDDASAVPHGGRWWAWFGGAEQAESAAMAQTFAMDVDSDSARLRFHLAINAAGGTGEDTFVVQVDGQDVFSVTDADIDDYSDYVEVELDMSAFADGQSHELSLAATLTGSGLTNFFVDDVSLQACGYPDDGGSSTGAADETGGSDGSGTGTGTGGGTGGSSETGEGSSSSSGG